jgi:hypothetical protein
LIIYRFPKSTDIIFNVFWIGDELKHTSTFYRRCNIRYLHTVGLGEGGGLNRLD